MTTTKPTSPGLDAQSLAGQVGPSDSALKSRAKALFTPPFKFNAPYIQDAKFNMVADQHEGEDLRVRGWGRIQYMSDAEALQDAAGAMIADALNAYYAMVRPTEQQGVETK